jgi:5-methylcytosine-specific restriction endonuclease McrA
MWPSTYDAASECHHGGTMVCNNCIIPKRLYDWNAVQRYFDEGNTCGQCVRRFGMTYTAWRKAIIRGELTLPATKFADRRRKHDWAAIQAFYDTGASVRTCAKHFGFHLQAWDKAVKRGELRPRHGGMPIATLLASSRRTRAHVKARLLHAGVLKNECSNCGLTNWLGNHITMHLDHINGVRDDHRLENLRMLCPNCHSQTPTYGGRNLRRKRLLQEPQVNV